MAEEKTYIIYRESLPQARRIVNKIQKLNKGVTLISSYDRPDWASRFMRHFPVIVLKRRNSYYVKTLTDVNDIDKLHDTMEFNEITDEVSLLKFKNLDETVYIETSKNLLFLYDPVNTGFWDEELKTPRVEALISALSLWLTEKEIRARKIVEDTVSIMLNSLTYDRELNLLHSGSFSYNWNMPTGEYKLEDNISFVKLLVYMAKSIPNRSYENIALSIFDSIVKNFVRDQDIFVAIYRDKNELKLVEKTSKTLSSYFVSLLTLIFRLKKEEDLLKQATEVFNKIDITDSGILEDWASYLEASINLYMATGKRDLLDRAHKIYLNIEDLFLDKERNLFSDTMDKSLPFRYTLKETSKIAECLIKLHKITDKKSYLDIANRLLIEIAKPAIDKGVDGLIIAVPLILYLFGSIDIKISGERKDILEVALSFITPLTTISYLEGGESYAQVCFSNKCFEPAYSPDILRDHIVSVLISGAF